MGADPVRLRPARQTPRRRLVSTTRPSALADPIQVFMSAAPAESRALWLQAGSGQALVGLGSAATFCGPPLRVAAEWREVLADADVDRTVPFAGPRLLGGFCFDPQLAPTRLWDGFGVGRMVLPERLFVARGQSAWLTTSRLVGPAAPVSQRPDVATLPPSLGLSAVDWQALVRDVAAVIGRGRAGLRKVVLARATRIRVRVSLEEALRTLAAEYPSCTIFAFATRDACFLGATPERLVALHDGTATTMALAGSAPRGATPAEDQAISARLLADRKERTEHAVVADALRKALAPLATRVVADAEPRVHALPNVQHLITPIRAQVPAGLGVLELVSGLHPTPAVGGYPRHAALEVIRRHERLDRGWYAGPIGWMDARGEGEFMVGLRSGLVRGESATLFAGGGIVADSDPAKEYAELGWKLRPMQRALGDDDVDQR